MRAIDEKELMKNHYLPYVKSHAFIISLLLKDMSTPCHEREGLLLCEVGEDEEPRRPKIDNLASPEVKPNNSHSRRTSDQSITKKFVRQQPSVKVVEETRSPGRVET